LRRPVIDDHAVDDVEGIGAGDERVGPAQAHRDATTAGTTRVLRDLRAGDFALHRLIDRYRLGAADQRRVDCSDARTDSALLRRRTRARDDDLAQVHGADVERDHTEVVVTAGDVHDAFDGLVPDTSRLDRARASRDSRERELALLPGQHADARAGDGDLRLGDATTRGGVGDASPKDAGGGLGVQRR